MFSLLLRICCIFFPLIISAGCGKIKNNPSENLKPSETYSLKISEPSGIALSGDNLWIVSDRKSTVYKTNLKGEIINSIKIDKTDFEGITVVDDSLLAIVQEIKREVFIINFEGKVDFSSSFKIDGNKNSGLEGITYNSSNGHFYILNEKNPVLLIEADKDLKELSRKEIKDVKDLSGISYSQKDNSLWIVSDEEKKIIKLSVEGEFITEYEIDINQAEGIAVDDKNNLLYVVSDKEEKLYVFKIE